MFLAYHINGFGRLVVCESHATDVWMWLWMESDAQGQPVEARGNDRACAVCTPGSPCPKRLEAAMTRQGRPMRKVLPLRRAA